jgi:hypothetical protein
LPRDLIVPRAPARTRRVFGLLLALFCGALVWLASPARAVASGHSAFSFGPSAPFPCGGSTTSIVTGLLLPSEVGAFLSDDDVDFMFAWSWQIPLSPACHSRLATELEVLPTDSHPVRGRLGYRYGTRYFLAGLGGTLSGAGYTWSPELGVQFAHWRFVGLWDIPGTENENSFHLIVRAELAPAFDGLRGVTLLLGWNVL